MLNVKHTQLIRHSHHQNLIITCIIIIIIINNIYTCTSLKKQNRGLSIIKHTLHVSRFLIKLTNLFLAREAECPEDGASQSTSFLLQQQQCSWTSPPPRAPSPSAFSQLFQHVWRLSPDYGKTIQAMT